MFRATIRVRLSVIAASAFVCLGFAAAPAVASTPNAGPARGDSAPTGWQHSTALAHPGQISAASIKKHNEQVREVLKIASHQRGKPYIYGDAGPNGFDCSGLVRFVFLHAVHRSLPHNAAAQYDSLRHISRKLLQPGDLVFVDNGGYVSHVGIYDGHGYWWVAPHTGTRVQRQKIYRAHFVYARVLVYDKIPKKHKS
jgi:cell wall-associated NlpC family hydrolase